TARSWRLGHPAHPFVLPTGERSHPSAIYSPDGARIAAIANRASGGRLMIARVDGEGEKTSLEAPFLFHEPAFSPDGSLVAVAAERDVVYLFASDGSGRLSTISPAQAPGSDGRSREGHGLAFSPDGK